MRVIQSAPKQRSSVCLTKMSAVSNSLPSLCLKPERIESLSEDLVQLLKSVDSCGFNLYEGPALQRGIWRYETMWLPLLGALSLVQAHTSSDDIDASSVPKNMRDRVSIIANRLRRCEGLSELEVVPPLDVAWVWYVHRLSVGLYLNDVTMIIGTPVAPSAASAFKYGIFNSSSQASLWKLAFSGYGKDDQLHDSADSAFVDYFPFYLQSLVNERGKFVARQAAVGSVNQKSYDSVFSYDITRGVQCHRGVLLQYMRNQDTSKDFLRAAVARYESFLILRCTYPGMDLEPADDIEFVWRVHIASLADYLSDDLVAEAFDGSEPEKGKTVERDLDTIYSHSDAHLVHYKRGTTEIDRQRLLSDTSDVWGIAFGNTRGKYLLPNLVPRMMPRGKRDGYLQEVLRNSAADAAPSSSSESESESSSDASAALHSRAPSTFRETQPANSPPVDSNASLSFHSEDRIDAVARASSTTSEATPASMVSSSIHSPTRSGAQVISSPKKKILRFQPEGQDASDQTSSEEKASAAERRRRKSETKLRREEEKQIQQDLHVRQSHGLKSTSAASSAEKAISNIQAGRAILLAVLGGALFITGAVVMRNNEESASSTVGVGIFFTGLICFLLAIVALSRPNSEQRKFAKAKALVAREQRAEEGREKQQAKAEKKAFINAIQELAFFATEERIVIGGGDIELRFTSDQIF